MKTVPKVDFSDINRQYLISVRDVAREDPEAAAPLLGIPLELADLFAQMSSGHLSRITELNEPILMVRGDVVWWGRLLHAIAEERPEEIEVAVQGIRLSFL